MALTVDVDGHERPTSASQAMEVSVRTPRKVDGGGAADSEGLMQEFVHRHMMSILRPFVEQIRDLQGEVEQLGSHASQSRVEVNKHREQLAQHQGYLSQMDALTRDLDGRLEATRGDLVAVERKSDECATDHGKTKAWLCKVEEKLQAACGEVEACKSTQQDSGSDVHRLQVGLKEVERKLSEQVDTRLNNLHKFCKDLNAQQADQLSALHQTKIFAESTQQALKQLVCKVEKMHEEDMEKFDCLHQHAKGLEAKLCLQSRDAQRQGDALKQCDKELQRLGSEFGKLMTFQQLHVNHSEVFLSLKETTRRVAQVEEAVADLKSHSASELQRFDDQLRIASEKVEETASSMQSLKTAQEKHSEQLRESAQRFCDTEHASAQILKRADLLGEEVQSLALWQQGATDKFEEHGALFQQLQKELQQEKNKLDRTSFTVDGMRGDLEATHKAISKLDSRLDVVQKYFTGFGKGLQETTRQVASEGGTLPAKAGFSLIQAGLPVLPGTPRGSLSPRRRRLPSKAGPCNTTMLGAGGC
eukprot:gb/GFBE01054814.1/.p1 GENE.gb/GFBE01054814.1/~~gb/GFBE01054814.1/.p1  ORF type:complete len:531 (+),score=143.71 gb/GFBE01054814.1/:1-1593(+)